ncbi:MAG: signal peptide peptidase SppA [Acidobacteriota bacterium]|nr:signal peptide peptidase SppA [Acidobacteriota bacterium]
MKKFLLGVLVGFAVSALTAVVFFFIVARVAASFGDRPVTVADGSTLVLKLEGSVPEKPAPDIPFPAFEDQSPITVLQVWETLRKAAADSRIKAVLFEPAGVGVGWARLEEIRAELIEFKKSGKPLVAYLRAPGTREYYLATAADKIYMSSEDTLDVKGLRVEALFVKNTLDKLGVKFDVIHAGKYKDAGDLLTQTSMTPETREVLNDILDRYYGDLVNTVASGRKKSAAEVREIIDNGPFMGHDALSRGLVDSLGFEDQAADDLKQRLNRGDLKRISNRAYLKASVPSLAGGKRIALIVGEGAIARGRDNPGFGGDTGITSGGFTKLLKQVANDSSIKGAIVRVDSPGGDAVASDEILHEVRNLSRKKPVVISMGDLAASGGYFISMTGDPIVAYPNTLTGSIGVIFAKINLKGLYDKIGIVKQPLSRGKMAELDSDYEPLSPAEQAKLRDHVDQIYQGFLKRVADGRHKQVADIEPLAQGRVWLGAEAKGNGLVDELGGLDKAVELIRKKAGMSATEKITLVPFPQKRSLFEMLLSSRSDENAAMDAALTAKIGSLLGGLPTAAWKQGGYLQVMPYTFKVF